MGKTAPEKQLPEMTLEELIAVYERDSEDDEGWADDIIETAAAIISYRGEPGIRYLLGLLSSADTAHTEAALSAFRDHELESHEIQEAMLRALNDSRPQVLYAAILGLQERGVRDVLPRVEPLIPHPSIPVRSAAMIYLARLYPEIAVKYVEQLHNDPSWIVRERVLTEMGSTDDEELAKLAVPCGLKSLDDPHPYVREDAAELVEYVYWEAKSPEELVAGQSDPDPRIRASAVRAYAHNALETAPDVIGAALADSERVVILNALDELFEIYRDNRGELLPEMPDISQWLTDGDAVIREAAEAATAARAGDYDFYVERY